MRTLAGGARGFTGLLCCGAVVIKCEKALGLSWRHLAKGFVFLSGAVCSHCSVVVVFHAQDALVRARPHCAANLDFSLQAIVCRCWWCWWFWTCLAELFFDHLGALCCSKRNLVGDFARRTFSLVAPVGVAKLVKLTFAFFGWGRWRRWSWWGCVAKMLFNRGGAVRSKKGGFVGGFTCRTPSLVVPVGVAQLAKLTFAFLNWGWWCRWSWWGDFAEGSLLGVRAFGSKRLVVMLFKAMDAFGLVVPVHFTIVLHHLPTFVGWGGWRRWFMGTEGFRFGSSAVVLLFHCGVGDNAAAAHGGVLLVSTAFSFKHVPACWAHRMRGVRVSVAQFRKGRDSAACCLQGCFMLILTFEAFSCIAVFLTAQCSEFLLARCSWGWCWLAELVKHGLGAFVNLLQLGRISVDAPFALGHVVPVFCTRCFHCRKAMVHGSWSGWGGSRDRTKVFDLRVGAVCCLGLIFVLVNAVNASSVVVQCTFWFAVFLKHLVALRRWCRWGFPLAKLGSLRFRARRIFQSRCMQRHALGAKRLVVTVVTAKQLFLSLALFSRRWWWLWRLTKGIDVVLGAAVFGKVGLVCIGACQARTALGRLAAVGDESSFAGWRGWGWGWWFGFAKRFLFCGSAV